MCAMPAPLDAYLAQLPKCHIRNRRLHEISPFAATWTQTGTLAGADATSRTEVLSTLQTELTRAVSHSFSSPYEGGPGGGYCE